MTRHLFGLGITWILQKLRIINRVSVNRRVLGLLDTFLQILYQNFFVIEIFLHLIILCLLFFEFFVIGLLFQPVNLFLELCFTTLCVSLNGFLFGSLPFVIRLALNISQRKQSRFATFTFKILQDIVVL
jgi:hypothetical protein